MKKLVKIVAMLLLITPLLFSCESLNGDLEDVTADTELFSKKTGGTEDGGDDIPDEPGG